MCDPVCQNGGTCQYPNSCACTQGWTGVACETGKMPEILNEYIRALKLNSQLSGLGVQIIDGAIYLVGSF